MFLTRDDALEIPMISEGQFWRIIESLGAEGVDGPGADEILSEKLAKRLGELSAENIAGFQDQFVARGIEAYRWDLWAVAEIALEDCRDDDFMSFRNWLISRGEVVFRRVLGDPDELGKVVGRIPGQELHLEVLDSVAGDVYGEMVGEEIPLSANRYPAHPIGKKWSSLEELRQRYPRTWAAFRD
jgi:hypothetical protein